MVGTTRKNVRAESAETPEGGSIPVRGHGSDRRQVVDGVREMNGDPNFRQLEPDAGMVGALGVTSPNSVRLWVYLVPHGQN